LLLAADRQSCQILDRQKLCDRTWVHPALAYGRFYVRDSRCLYCYDMRVAVNPTDPPCAELPPSLLRSGVSDDQR
jgi:hypothetical protein